MARASSVVRTLCGRVLVTVSAILPTNVLNCNYIHIRPPTCKFENAGQ
jgi:hypothetical protein